MSYGGKGKPLEKMEVGRQIDRKDVVERLGKAGEATSTEMPAVGSDQAELKHSVADRQYTNARESEARLQAGAEQGEPIINSFDSPVQRAKAEQFYRDFADRPGADHVRGDAIGPNWSKRAGADHHINVANELDGKVKAFEETITPESTGKSNHIDIVTTDDYAVECKTAHGDQISLSTIGDAHRQAMKRLEPNAEGKSYRGVVIVCPDGALAGEAADKAGKYEAQNPSIRFCEKSKLKQTLEAMDKARGGG